MTADKNTKNMEFTIEAGYKIWLKGKNDLFPKFNLGPGDVELMKSLVKHQNLTKAAEEVGYSYKYAWRKLKDIEKLTGIPVKNTSKGGSGGGGKVEITPWGHYLIKKFDQVHQTLSQSMANLNKELNSDPFFLSEKK